MSYVSVLWGIYANYSYFDTCSRPHASTALAYNWSGYGVMVLQCTHCITHITLRCQHTTWPTCDPDLVHLLFSTFNISRVCSAHKSTSKQFLLEAILNLGVQPARRSHKLISCESSIEDRVFFKWWSRSILNLLVRWKSIYTFFQNFSDICASPTFL